MSSSSTRAFAPLSQFRENGNTLNSGFPMRIQNGVLVPKTRKLLLGDFILALNFRYLKAETDLNER